VTGHEAAALRLADFAAGRLSGGERAEIEAHALQCSDCREMAEAYRMMAAAAVHPESSAIAERAILSEAVKPGDEVTAHLGSCADCADDLAAARAANAVAGMRETPFTWLPLAAAVLAGVLGLAAFVSWRDSASLTRRLSALESENGTLRTQVAELEKPPAPPAGEKNPVVSYLFLRAAERGTAAPARLVLPAGGQDAYLALGLAIPATLRQAGEPAHLVMSDAEGRSVWETDIAGAPIDASLSGGEALLVKIPTGGLRPGRHAILLTAAPGSPHAGRTWFRSEFEIAP
jgi:hypothetical protein